MTNMAQCLKVGKQKRHRRRRIEEKRDKQKKGSRKGVNKENKKS